ncbi:cell division protein FtsQ/DivIB [Streptococcus iniae]|uniref:Cell division protein DivIB n=1 Tax=Streptococcus iniae TaxID=1346 RepID=A0A3L8HQX8_STRIN|nr:FtsQ-type POTRA domain-containing protein [Streptococcus iniae]ELY5747300.1 FtsQ-type POTRA domain-containing protein [Streptococcus iniae]ESR09671.1 cell division protein [Streptococcus iniae IUSA1]KYJ76603.1 cell division protein [Streptococcus iniae]MCA1358172.1 FtsQ-type POTRA domain-containing protein [Streptococcus iniae]RLU55370.1 cell division protein FtsQ/DivIB [Streptococcus iniae]
MTKNKKKTENQPVNLSEWQKRNIEFLEKKRLQEEEEEKRREKLLLEKKAEFQKEQEEVVSEISEEDEQVSTEEIAVEETVVEEEREQNVEQESLKTLKTKKVKREKSRRELAFIKAIPVLLISLLMLSGSLFMLTPYSKNKVFSTKGNKHTSLTELIDQSKIKDSDYISKVWLSSSKFETAIKNANPWIKDVLISYDFPNRFTFDVKEYNIIAYAQEENGLQPILENGRRVDMVNHSKLPKSYLIINLKDETAIQNLVKDLTKLPKELVKNIKSVSSIDSKVTQDLLLIELHDGNLVRVPQSQLLEKMPYYPKVKGKTEGAVIVDMEVGIYSTTSDIEATPATPIENKEALKQKTKEQQESSENQENGQTASNETGQSSGEEVPTQPGTPTSAPAVQ